MSSDVVLSVKGVSKRYEIYDKPSKRLWQMIFMGKRNFFKEFWALRDVSFDIRRGESWGIVGRNGAGKSTLLKIITGTLQPTRGRVVGKGKIAALLELGSGFNPEFTGRENVFLNASILGLTRAETEAKYQEIVEFADIGSFIDQPVKKYSSGMKLRLAFAVQIMVKPDVLIVDEALAVGDMFFQQKCMARMRKLREEGTTLLFVSHSLGTVRNLCDKAIYLDHGQVVAVGDSKSICEQYQLSEVKKTAAPAPTQGVRNSTAAIKAEEPAGDRVFRYREDPLVGKRCSERRGSGEVKVMAADFYDAKGNRVTEVTSGEKVRLVLSFLTMKDIPAGASISTSFRDFHGKAIAGVKLPAFGVTLQAFPRGAKFTVSYDWVLPMTAGDYFLVVAIQPDVHDDEHRYDLCIGLTALRLVKSREPFYQYSYGHCHISTSSVMVSRQSWDKVVYRA